MTPRHVARVVREPAGRAVVLRYLAVLAGMSLDWEFAQMPHYTLWTSGSRGEIAFAGLHCTLGDLMIAAAMLVLALLAVGPAEWPAAGRLRVLAAATALGLGYAAFREGLRVELRETKEYSAAMPRLPVLGTGLSPLLQWAPLPPAAHGIAFRGTRYWPRGQAIS